jgi:hypothetical protein
MAIIDPHFLKNILDVHEKISSQIPYPFLTQHALTMRLYRLIGTATMLGVPLKNMDLQNPKELRINRTRQVAVLRMSDKDIFSSVQLYN